MAIPIVAAATIASYYKTDSAGSWPVGLLLASSDSEIATNAIQHKV